MGRGVRGATGAEAVEISGRVLTASLTPFEGGTDLEAGRAMD